MVCITETWLSDSCPDSCVDLDGFSVFPLTSPLTPERREAVVCVPALTASGVTTTTTASGVTTTTTTTTSTSQTEPAHHIS